MAETTLQQRDIGTQRVVARKDPLKDIFPEHRIVNFMYRQDRQLFFSMLNELVRPDDVVLDYGAGRGSLADFGGPHLRRISTLQGRVARIIGMDVDDVVLRNPIMDEAHVITPGARLPLADNSIDLIYSFAVFEHIQDEVAAAAELARVVKPGGWICAFTPNKWGYISIGARMVPDSMHGRVLTAAEPGGRKAFDVFPTCYRMNTLSRIRQLFPDDRFENFSFGFNGQPSYNFGSKLIARFWLFYMAIMPRSMAQSLFIFIRKRA